jgi:ribonuclease G
MRKEILINHTAREVRVAVLENGELVEIFVERERQRGIVGNIYLGRVSKVLPGMQSAFVDIGLPRDAFLYVSDIQGNQADDDSLDRLGEDEDDDESVSREDLSRRIQATARVEDLVREGSEILVQVTKESLPNKGARITGYLSLPGRYMVLMPGVNHIGVSRKFDSPRDRDRLRRLVSRLRRPGEGFIVRTAGTRRPAEELERDVRYLQSVWDDIRTKKETARPPMLLHEELDVSRKILRDMFGTEYQRVLIDHGEAFRRCRDFIARFQPELARRVRRYSEEKPLFEEFGIEAELEKALRNRVWLRSGGHLVIHQTEALVAIDVNTGKFVGKRRLEETVLQTNLEAAREIVRQVRLRDLGGIIVVDFIDMEEKSSKRELIRTLQAELEKDRAKTRLLQISDFGLVEITRQRRKRSLERTLCQPCPYCTGTGRIRSAATVSLEVEREIEKRAARLNGRQLVVRVHPDVAALLEEEKDSLLAPSTRGGAVSLEIHSDASLHREQFDIAAR